LTDGEPDEQGELSGWGCPCRPQTVDAGTGKHIEISLISFLSSSSQILNRRHPIPYSLPLPASADACDLLWVGHFYLGGQQSQSVHRDCSSIARAVEAIWLPSGSSFPGRWPRRHPRRLVRHVHDQPCGSLLGMWESGIAWKPPRRHPDGRAADSGEGLHAGEQRKARLWFVIPSLLSICVPTSMTYLCTYAYKAV
jgi:hypothetical protein